MPEQQAEKQKLRETYRNLRKQRTLTEKTHCDLAMQNQFCQSAFYRTHSILLLYAAMTTEPDTAWIFSQALQDEKIVGFPKCLPNRQMRFYQVTNSQQLQRGAYGILEPDAACPEIVLSPETEPHSICLVPGLAFARNGNRLGYGGGYYDRFFQQHPKILRVGYCPAAFVAEQLPREELDVPVQFLVTEQFESSKEDQYGSKP